MLQTMTRPPRDPSSTSTGASPPLLATSAHAFENLSNVLLTLSELCPPRMSVRQLLAFAMIGYANAMGKKLTLAEVREQAGEALGQSIERTIQAFFAPNKREPDALDWLAQEPDPDDGRKKYLILTPKGRRVVNELTKALDS